MCLILFAINNHPKYKLILAANRDEFFERPTLAADYWKENRNILAGRDIKSQGTWIGINKNGRFIAITNYRDPNMENKNAKSRGDLSSNFLNSDQNISSFIAEISDQKGLFNGFNLLLSDDGFNSLYHYSNVSDTTTLIKDGIHGLSNHLLNTSWPKVNTGRDKLKQITISSCIELNDLIQMLQDGNTAPDNLLPQTGISFDLEKKLSPVFISMKGYGTRCSTAILVDNKNNVSFVEVSYDETGHNIMEQQYKITLKS